MQPYAVDRFADADVSGPRIRTDGSSQQVLAAASQMPPGPWLYTGALENRPTLVTRLSQQRPLWGNPPAVLRAVRDVDQLSRAVRHVGFHFPETVRSGPIPEGRWLRKPYHSCGGLRVTGVDPTNESPPDPTRQFYWQRRIDGLPVAAVFVAGRDRCALLGVTEQLYGLDEAASPPFQYAGSIGPLSAAEVPVEQIRRLGQSLAVRFHLTGLFGVDMIQRQDEIWVLEVNPRYTASVEILERDSDESAIRLHALACQCLPWVKDVTPRRAWHGKAIVYADREVRDVAPMSLLAEQWNRESPLPSLADIPAQGTSIGHGSPIVSVLATGQSRSEVISRLRERIRQVRSVIAVSKP